MKRAGRYIYNGATTLSLLLCLATVGVWVRSYWVGDFLRWDDFPSDQSYRDMRALRSSKGGLQFIKSHSANLIYALQDNTHFRYFRSGAAKYPLYESANSPLLLVKANRHAALGFEVVVDAKTTAVNNPSMFWIQSTFTLPLYFPTLLFALLPAHYFLRLRRHRRIANRRAHGCCIACGYDLRASPGRCPECGRKTAYDAPPSSPLDRA